MAFVQDALNRIVTFGKIEPDASSPRNIELASWITNQFYGLKLEAYDAIQLHVYYQLDPNITDDGMLSLQPSAGSKRVKGKIGRMLRKVSEGWLPITDSDIERWTTEIQEEFIPEHLSVTYHTTRDRIGDIYKTDHGSMRSFFPNRDHKALCDSCMRYQFDLLPHHPADAYNSGDFELHYLLDREGRLAARSLVYIGNQTRGPIYGRSESAIRYLDQQMDRCKAYEGDWEGARLLAFPHHGDLIGPYLDLEPKSLHWSEGEEFMTIGAYGNVDGSDHQGVLTVHTRTAYCNTCGDWEPEDIVEDGLCDHCAVVTYDTEERIPNRDAVLLYVTEHTHGWFHENTDTFTDSEGRRWAAEYAPVSEEEEEETDA